MTKILEIENLEMPEILAVFDRCLGIVLTNVFSWTTFSLPTSVDMWRRRANSTWQDNFDNRPMMNARVDSIAWLP